MTRPHDQQTALLPPMKWNAWGDPAEAKPLSEGIRSLLKQALGLEDATTAELEADQVRLRPSALSQADRDALGAIVGAEYCNVDDRARLLRAGGKSTLDLLRRKDFGVQDAPDAVLLPGGEEEVAEILRFCADRSIAIVPFGGGTSVVGGLDPTRGDFKVQWKFNGERKASLGTLYYPSYFNGGIAVHGSPSIPPYPASHGCVRVPRFADKALYKMMPVGMPVFVYDHQ